MPGFKNRKTEKKTQLNTVLFKGFCKTTLKEIIISSEEKFVVV